MKRLLLAVLAPLLLAPSIGATWSIVVVNTLTGEVGVAVASCTPTSDLHVSVPVVVVGQGTAVWQANGDALFKGRPVAWSTLMAGGTVQDVIDGWLDNDNFPNGKQVGVASLAGDAAAFTGIGTFDWAGDRVGVAGEWIYAIQGNILVGQEVVDATEDALVNTPGDMGQRLLAAMEAGTALGGDGRCSCSQSDPTGCGAPPPDFDKASQSGFVVVGRIGDVDGVCDQTAGCGNGSYWLDLNYVGPIGSGDAVAELREQYDAWRADMAGRPDGLLSTVTPSAQSLPADGTATMEFEVQLVDLDGVALTAGVQSFACAPALDNTSDAVCTGVEDLGGGRYRVTIGQATTPGVAAFDVVADDGVTRATLYPRPSVRVDAVTPLHAGFDAIDAAADTTVPFVINAPGSAGAAYVVLASLSGTSPGTPFGSAVLPLNMDETLVRTWRNADDQGDGGHALLSRTKGFLDGAGRAEAAFRAPPGLLLNLVGERVDWAVLTVQDGAFGVTNAVGFDVVHGAGGR